MSRILACVSLVMLFSAAAFAADGKAPQKPAAKPTLPPSGLIAGTKVGEYGATQIDGPWGGINTATAKVSPISGSCAKSDSFHWALRVFNNSKDRYNASLELQQSDLRNRIVKTDAFYSSIAPGQKIERIYPASPDAAQCAVKLSNWKMIASKKTPDELKQAIEKKKAQLAELEGELPKGPADEVK